MELNQTPVRTSKNYGINSINIEKNAIFAQKIENMAQNSLIFNNYTISGNNCFETSNDAKTLNSNILNEELSSEINQKCNFNANINFLKNTVKPVIINFNFDNNNDILIGNLNLNVKSGVNTKIILRFNSENTISYNNCMININIEDESTANIVVFNDNIFGSETFLSIESNLAKNANLDLNIVDFASKDSIFSYKSNILDENSSSNLNSLYVGVQNSTIDLNYMINVLAPNSKTNIDVLGAISGTTRKHFKGTIDFKKGCKKSVGQENEFCILLSNTAKSKALPMILCTEEDVDGKHSSAVGKVDEKQLFYVMSRGFTYDQALKILVKARFNNIISKIFDEDLRLEILNKIDGKIEWKK